MKPTSDLTEVERVSQETIASTHIEEPTDTPEIKKRRRALQVANSINAIEGVPTSEYANELAERWANGELTGEQMKQLLREYHLKIAASAKDPNEK